MTHFAMAGIANFGRAALLAGAAAALAPAAALGQSPEDMQPEEVHASYRETGASRDWVGIYSPGAQSAAKAAADPAADAAADPAADPAADATDAAAGAAAREVCAIYSRPTESLIFEGSEEVDGLRGERAAFINWNAKAPTPETGEISFMVGAPVAEGAGDHELVVDAQVGFELVGVDDRLYVRPADDSAAIAALRGGAAMVVTGELGNGRMIRDAYSLFGVQGATAISVDECE